MKPNLSDQERIQQYLLTTSKSSFETLYNGYIRKAYKQCVSLLIDAEDAQSVTQAMMIPAETPANAFANEYQPAKWTALTNRNENSLGPDLETFSLFYDTHAPSLFGFIRRAVGDPAEAEHILEATFLKAWPALAYYKASRGSCLLDWLLPIAYSVGLPRS